jgi:acetyl-CoA carboxylase, biotin carboxyl carrier protein
MDLNLVRELVSMMENSRLSSMEIELKDMKIKMSKNPEDYAAADEAAARPTDIKQYEAVTVSEAPASKAEAAQNKDEDDSQYAYIKAPMVGTFYASPSPDSAPFAAVGKNVKKGDIVCIIEAMKLMNEIECEENGEVVEVLVKNGEMVEYGQPLYKIRK